MESIVETLPRTAAVLAEGMRAGRHFGAQLYVSVRGRPVVDAAVGWAREGVEMSTETVNAWFSSGKPLTAVAVAREWEEGRLDCDAPVAELIPEFGTRGKEIIRIRHLLNHTAGFRDGDRVPDLLPWERTIAAICEVPLESGWVPGARAGYQLFSSWLILGELVRRVDGRSIDRWMAEEIFGPVGMHDCWMGLPPEQFIAYGDRIGPMHFLTQGRLRPHPVWNDRAVAAAVRPGSNVRGPIRELGRFYEALLGWREVAGRKGLLRAATVEQMIRPSRGALYDETFRHVMDWGLGFGVKANGAGGDMVPYGFGRHASAETFGHGGSQSSCGFADPARDLAAAWVCNGMIGEAAHQDRARGIQAAIYEDLGLV